MKSEDRSVGDTLVQLLARDDVTVGDPAPRAAVDAVAKRFGGALPAALIKLWSASDGIVFDSLDAHILGPADVVRMLDESAQPWASYLLDQGFLPILDDHQSNYLVVNVREPLAFRVTHLPHDDDRRPLYRDVDSFLLALPQAVASDESADSFFRATDGDYPPDAPRTEADQSAARALMATDGMNEEWNYAAQLLDASNLAEWATLLETDHFVRRDVVARMEKMTDPAIRDLLQRDRAAFEEFAHTVAKAARAAGLNVGRRQPDALQVNGRWMNLEGFFYRRNVPDAIPRTITWFEDLIAGRDPHKRPGHFMSD